MTTQLTRVYYQFSAIWDYRSLSHTLFTQCQQSSVISHGVNTGIDTVLTLYNLTIVCWILQSFFTVYLQQLFTAENCLRTVPQIFTQFGQHFLSKPINLSLDLHFDRRRLAPRQAIRNPIVQYMDL